MTATTRTYAALLRGINVAGHSTVKMDVLRALFVDLGHTEVTSYLQSGNLVFRSSRLDASALRKSIEDRIRAELGLELTVLIRSDDDMQLVLRTNPFFGRTADFSTLHVTFLADVPSAARLAQLPRGHGSEELSVVRGEIYLWCPDGYGRSKLTNTVLEKRLATRATTRNWKTVMKLAQLTS